MRVLCGLITKWESGVPKTRAYLFTCNYSIFYDRQVIEQMLCLKAAGSGELSEIPAQEAEQMGGEGGGRTVGSDPWCPGTWGPGSIGVPCSCLHAYSSGLWSPGQRTFTPAREVVTGWYITFTGCYMTFTGCYMTFTGYYITFTGCHMTFTGCHWMLYNIHWMSLDVI